MSRGVRNSLVGKKFGKLTVEEYAGTDKFRNSLWRCKCQCGREVIERGSWLTKGLTTKGKIVSCGVCSEKFSKDFENPIEEDYIDKSLIGQRFGRLIVKDVYLKVIDKKTNKRQMYTKCICDCGNEKEIPVFSLKNGNTLSCGCLRKEKATGTKYSLSDDFIGQRFGKLVVKGFDDKKHLWKCECDCGNIKYLKKGSLTNNGYRSCGNCYGKKSRNRRKGKRNENTNKNV